MKTEKKILNGWGRTISAYCNLIKPKNIEEIQSFIDIPQEKKLITRGLGRSYGDASYLTNGNVIDLVNFQNFEIDTSKGLVKAGSGLSVREILSKIIPLGFFLPVSPGTSKVTLGGAIACDVHGKNHHKDKSFGSHVQKIVLLDGEGNLNELFPNNFISEENSKKFWATIGGMGLTGIIIEAVFSVIPISTSYMRVDTFKYKTLEDLMKAMVSKDKEYKYSVAWVDSLSKEGRGVLSCGEHVSANELISNEKDMLKYDPTSVASAPNLIPNGLLNKYTVKAFNEAWFRKASLNMEGNLTKISSFFHPLDGIDNWNRIYGKKGFIQYQFVVPDESDFLIHKTFEILREAKSNSFLTVLKRFGESNKGFLSFPKKGWTLAIDIPANNKNLNIYLKKLDELIIQNFGRFYLAKDSIQSHQIFKNSYPKYEEWLSIKKDLDPKNIFYSDLSKRLKIEY